MSYTLGMAAKATGKSKTTTPFKWRLKH